MGVIPPLTNQKDIHMNTFRNRVLIGLTVLGMGSASLAAHADDNSPPPAGRHGSAVNKEQMQAKMAERWTQRQAKLHDLLKLSAAQEAAWSTYQAAIKPEPHTGEHTPMSTLSAPDRLSKMIDMSKQRTTAMQAHLAALQAFYGTLSVDQKAIFDAHTMGGAKAGHHRMDWMHHG